jgi:cytochrome b6-f complex iron-sulfur subunit
MMISRRHFLLLTAGLVAGCATDDNIGSSVATAPRVVDAGPVSQYAVDGVYNQFRDRGFFVVREGDKLFALSAICTHRRCKLFAEPDRTFYCKCHGSAFDPTGKVITGPARRDLPMFSAQTDGQGRLLVTVTT